MQQVQLFGADLLQFLRRAKLTCLTPCGGAGGDTGGGGFNAVLISCKDAFLLHRKSGVESGDTGVVTLFFSSSVSLLHGGVSF